MEFNELPEELKTKALACKTPEEMLALAREAGYEISEEELEAVSGGIWSCSDDLSDCNGYTCKVVCSSTSKGVGPTKIM